MSNFFDQCNGVVGFNSGTQTNHYDQRELTHDLEKARLEIEKLRMEVEKMAAEREKAEMEARYWREKKAD